MPALRFAAPKERRVALVTGGARGIGAACALRIAEEGRLLLSPAGKLLYRKDSFWETYVYVSLKLRHFTSPSF